MKFKVYILAPFLFGSFTLSAQESNFKKFKRLGCPEKRWVLCHPFVAKKALVLTEKAKEVSAMVKQEKLLKGNGNGGQLDAFRHTYWMATLTESIGWRRARKLGKAHEKGNYKDYKRQRLEEGALPDKVSSDMDLFNNKVGIELGKANSGTTFKFLVVNAVKQGRCKIIRKNHEGHFLDCDGNIIPDERLRGQWDNEKCLVRSDMSD